MGWCALLSSQWPFRKSGRPGAHGEGSPGARDHNQGRFRRDNLYKPRGLEAKKLEAVWGVVVRTHEGAVAVKGSNVTKKRHALHIAQWLASIFTSGESGSTRRASKSTYAGDRVSFVSPQGLQNSERRQDSCRIAREGEIEQEATQSH